MQDRHPRHKDVPEGGLPEPVELQGRHVRVELKGPLGCLAGGIMLAIALAILLVAAFAGLIALAMAFWVGLGFVAIAIIVALVRGRLGAR